MDYEIAKLDPAVAAVLATPIEAFRARLEAEVDAARVKYAHDRMAALQQYARAVSENEQAQAALAERLLWMERKLGELASVPGGDLQSVPAGTVAGPALVTKQRLAEWRLFASVPVARWESAIADGRARGRLSTRALLREFGAAKERRKPAPAGDVPVVPAGTVAQPVVVPNHEALAAVKATIQARSPGARIQARRAELDAEEARAAPAHVPTREPEPAADPAHVEPLLTALWPSGSPVVPTLPADVKRLGLHPDQVVLAYVVGFARKLREWEEREGLVSDYARQPLADLRLAVEAGAQDLRLAVRVTCKGGAKCQ